MARKRVAWAVVILLILGIGGAVWREYSLVRQVRQAQAEFDRALDKFEEAAELPEKVENLPWPAQYIYLKSNVYPEREKQLGQAQDKLNTIKGVTAKTWNWKLRPGLQRYQAAASELLAAYQKIWANEKGIDKAFNAGDWPERQRLALERPPLVEEKAALQQTVQARWKATGL